MIKSYLIENIGCDDETKFEINLTDDELKTILRFIKLNNKNSSYGCQPTINIYKNYLYDEDFRPQSYLWIGGKFHEAEKLNIEEEEERC